MSLALDLALFLAPSWAYLAGATAAAARFARRRPAPAAERPPASVLKPLHGAEPGLYENLRSFVEQDYPVHQTILGVTDAADGALPAATALARDLPGRDIARVVGGPGGNGPGGNGPGGNGPGGNGPGGNGKIANLENMLPAAKHDVIVLADSDMRVGPDYLAAVTAPLADPGVGLVTCLYAGVATGGMWSQLGALHINLAFLPGALIADSLGVGNGCFGATIALRRQTLERIGGFARWRDELADDHKIGAAVREAGLRVVLSPYLVATQVGEPDFWSLWRHELRWARTVRGIAPIGFAGSIVSHPVALAVLAAVAAGFRPTACGCLALTCALRSASAGLIARALRLPAIRWHLLPMRDALSFAVFIASFFGRTVFWRDRLLGVEPNGRISAKREEAL
jgi:ceramide glucosyltransferase